MNPQPAEEPRSEKIATRYRDAYRVASVIVGMGSILKVIGGVIFVIISYRCTHAPWQRHRRWGDRSLGDTRWRDRLCVLLARRCDHLRFRTTNPRIPGRCCKHFAVS